MNAENAKYSIRCSFHRKEFVGQKSLSQSEDEPAFGESVGEILDWVWTKALPLMKREVIVIGEEIAWNVKVVPTRDDMGKFVIFRDPQPRKCYTVDQLNSTLLSRLRGKELIVMVHAYGIQLCNKTVHGQFVSRLLQPEERDRANANSTKSLMELVAELQLIHGDVYAAHISIWQRWANTIQASPPHLQDSIKLKPPPSELIHMFIRASTSESEVLESVQRGLQVADNLNDSYGGQLTMLRGEFNKFRQDVNRGFDYLEARLNAFEGVLSSNRRLVNAMSSSVTPVPSAVSVQEESLITDMEDVDHV